MRFLLILALALLLAGPLGGCAGIINVNFCGPQDEVADVFKRKDSNER